MTAPDATDQIGDGPTGASETPAVGGAAEPRWLTPDEQRTWRAFYAASTVFLACIDRELQHDAGVPHAYYEILVALSESPARRLRMSDLAERSLSSRSRLSHAVSRLEDAGWIGREPCPDDRRGSFAVLTDEGLSVLETAAGRHVEGVRRHLFDLLDAGDLGALQRISDKLVAHFAEFDPGMAKVISGLSPGPAG
ncbi:MAG: MarR family winged helix-turn-helix transcriptional regulator [Mycobacteriales bacterium]